MANHPMKYLIITSSGGSAHLTAARAERDSLVKANYQANEIKIVDIMGVDKSITTTPGETWIPSYGIPYTEYQFFSGHQNVNYWNSAQKMGGMESVRKLEQLINKQYLAEHIQAKKIYSELTKFLQENPDLEEIIDTQPLSSPEICKAVTEENERRLSEGGHQKPIKVRKIISEFITNKTVHYLDPLSRVEKQHADCLTVEIVNTPLKLNTESDEDFYKRKKIDHIKFEIKPAPLRAEFYNPIYSIEKAVYLKSEVDSLISGPLKERAYLTEALANQGEQLGDHFKLSKRAQDKFFLITLGSQGSLTILRYIDAFIDQVSHGEIKPDQRRMLFVAAGKNDGSSDTIYALVRAHIEKRMTELAIAGIDWPESAKIIPLGFQDDKGMASLFKNTDVLITRTGGMASIEVNETQQFNPTRKVYLHSEAITETPDIFPKENFDACYDKLLDGTVCWESGNAQYLMQSIAASLTSPETVLFDLNDRPSSLSFKGSLIHMTSEGTLARANLAKIAHCLKQGSNPNLESFAGLPALAHAKDVTTAALLINYGGKLTSAVQAHLKLVVSDEEMSQLLKLEKTIKKEIKRYGYGAPKEVFKSFITATKTGLIDEVKGMLYRYPQLADIKLMSKKGNKIISITDIARHAKQEEVLKVIERAQGSTQLQLTLQSATTQDVATLKRLVYLNQLELNKEYTPKVTPLTLCKDKELRKLMVTLGANPYYLSKNVSRDERAILKKEYIKSHATAQTLKTLILDTYLQYATDEAMFCATLKKHVTSLSEDWKHREIPESLLKVAFNGLKNAANDIERMTLIEQLINTIKKYLFSTDISSKQSLTQSRKFLFYFNVGDAGDDGIDNEPPPAITPSKPTL